MLMNSCGLRMSDRECSTSYRDHDVTECPCTVFGGVHRIGPQARGPSPEQNPINEFLVHKREIVPQHKFCVHVIHAPKVRFDSNETARLATTTRALPIPEYGPSVSNQTLLMFRKTVHTGTTIVEVVATYEHAGAGPVSVRSLCFSFLCEKVCEYFGRVLGGCGP